MEHAQDHARYYQAVQAEAEALDALLADLRAKQDSGELDVRAAADLRISALEHHLAALQQLRTTHLGDTR